jgi:hypothetical protein
MPTFVRKYVVTEAVCSLSFPQKTYPISFRQSPPIPRPCFFFVRSFFFSLSPHSYSLSPQTRIVRAKTL